MQAWYARGLEVVVKALYTPGRAKDASDPLEDDFLRVLQAPTEVSAL
jgi:hypothetical protein